MEYYGIIVNNCVKARSIDSCSDMKHMKTEILETTAAPGHPEGLEGGLGNTKLGGSEDQVMATECATFEINTSKGKCSGLYSEAP